VLNFPYLVDFIHKTKQNCFPRAPDMLPSSFSPSAGIFLFLGWCQKQWEHSPSSACASWSPWYLLFSGLGMAQEIPQ
jgi:hypothetical protein